MENLLNPYDKEYMKMAMLKHEETFRHQVSELHRLYRIQKMLMKDAATAGNTRRHPHYASPAGIQFPDPTRPAGKYSFPAIEDEQSDLELTLGPRSYYQKKIKASEPELRSDSGTSFSSSSTGSNHIKLPRQKWGLPTAINPVSNQDRLSSPPWILPSLNLT
ncbi:uncharacterized protein LOC127258270 isoform X2 [Andrographis paniculata]|nr:uncharacterized protein LOC127258270 isoform X2 [Andrographis paniculata]